MDYTKYLSDSFECIDNFNKACDAMAASSFIMSERRVREVLKAIAASKRLLSIFAYAASGFNFENQFELAVGLSGDKYYLSFPENPRAHIAFMYCILSELDGKSIDIHKLLNEYYYNEDGPNESYKTFVKNITKFKENVNTIYMSGEAPDLFKQ